MQNSSPSTAEILKSRLAEKAKAVKEANIQREEHYKQTHQSDLEGLLASVVDCILANNKSWVQIYKKKNIHLKNLWVGNSTNKRKNTCLKCIEDYICEKLKSPPHNFKKVSVCFTKECGMVFLEYYMLVEVWTG